MNNNFIMVEVSQSQRLASTAKEPTINNTASYSQQPEKQQSIDYANYDSQFMPPTLSQKGISQNGFIISPKKQTKSKVLEAIVVQKALQQIYTFYSQLYARQIKQYTTFNQITKDNLRIQSFILFTKNFRILKTIFPIERIVQIFKKHADYGKYLTLQNFYFLINSMSHQPESKNYFRLQSMTNNLDIQTLEQIQKQQFYSFLHLQNPQKYRQNFTDLFGAFNCLTKPRTDVVKYHYRKFSLPQLRKKAFPQPKQRKKGEKDLFIMKNDTQVQRNAFDQVKSIVVSWDSLRSKSVSNLGGPSQKVQKKYLKRDPEDDPYLSEMRAGSRPGPKSKSKIENLKSSQHTRISKIEQKIKQIQQIQNIKNQQILSRIDKKLLGKSNRKLNI